MSGAPQGSFNFHIGMDGTVEVAKTLRSLKADVSGLTQAWKAQEINLKSAGDNTAAAEARYKGLTETVGAQKAVLTQLKQKQSELDRSTTEGAESFAKMQKQVSQAEAKLASLSAQQSRAKDSMQYYKTGIAGAQDELRKITTVSESYVKRLQAEGRETEASKTQLKSLQSEYRQMQILYQKQSSELERIERESGKTSAAYAKQIIRVNELGTKLATTKREAGELSETLSKSSGGSFFDTIKTKILGVNKEAKETHSIFKSAFAADLLSNAVQGVWSKLTGAIREATSKAKEYSLAQQTMNATWTTLTGNAKEGQKMVDMTNSMAIAANNATDMVDDMNQKFYAISKNADTTKALTKSVLTLQDAFGKSDDEVKNFSTQFGQMMANGKVSAQDMMSFVNVFPVLRTNLLKTEQQITHNSKLSMKQMNDMMSAGKISSATMEKVLKDTAKQYGAATENFGKTIPGMKRTIESQMPVLLSAITTPLTTATNPIIGTLSGWVSSSKTKAMFSQVGKTFATGLNKTISAASSGTSSTELVDGLNKAVMALDKTIANVFDFLALHAKDLSGIGGDLVTITGELAKDLWKSFAGTVVGIAKAFGLIGKNADASNNPLGLLRKALDKIAQNPDAIKKVADLIITIGAVKTLTRTARGLNDISTAIGNLRKGADKLVNNEKFGQLLDKITKASGKHAATKTDVDVAKELGDDALSAAGDAGMSRMALKNAGGASKLAGVGSKLVGAGSKVASVAGTAGTAALGLLTGPVGITVAAVAGVGTAATIAYKKYKPFHDFVNKSGKAIGSAFTSMGKSVKKGFDSIGPASSKALKSVKGFASDMGSKVASAFKGLAGKALSLLPPKDAKELQKNFGNLKKAAGDFGGTFGKQMGKLGTLAQKGFKSALKFATNFGTNFKKAMKSIGAAVGKEWTKAMGVLSKAFKSFQKAMAPLIKAVQKLWSAEWKIMTDVAKKFWKFIEPLVKTGMKVLTVLIGGAMKVMQKTWSVAWDVMKTSVKTTIGVIKTVIGTALKVIKDVWSGEWDAIKKVLSAVFKIILTIINTAMKTLTHVIKAATDLISGNWSGAWKEVKKTFSTIWDGVLKIGKTVMGTLSDLISGVLKTISKVWHDMWKGMSDSFSKIINGLKDITKSAMNGVIGVINGAIGGINWIINKFGGKKETIKPIKKLATGTGAISGTRRAITAPTPVMLNDGPEADNRELVVKADGRSYMHQEHNALDFLTPGDEVLNASETKMLFNSAGLTHYATGTGLFSWIGNAFDSLKDKIKTVANVVAHPIKSFEKYFSGKINIGDIGTIPKAIGEGFKTATVKQAQQWWKTAFDLISGAINGGADGGAWSHSPGSGFQITSGFGHRGAVAGGYSTHDGVDFSGSSLVHAMHGGTVTHAGGAPSGWGGSRGIGESIVVRGSDGYSVIYQELNGKSNSGAGLKVKVGDSVTTGQALATLGPSGTHVHVGVTKHPMFSIPGTKLSGWEDITKMQGSSDGSAKKKSGGSALSKLVKGQLGSGVFKWISKYLAPLIQSDSGGSGDSPAGTGVQRWKPDVKKALSKLGLSTSSAMINKVLRQINTESGGNAKAIGGTDGLNDGRATGLMQVKPGTFAAYKLAGHGNIMDGYDNMLAGLNYAKHRYGSSLSFLGNGHGYANGGFANTASIFGEDGLEAAIPMSAVKASRGYELLGKTAAAMAARDGVQTDSNSSEKLDKIIALLTALVANDPATLVEAILGKIQLDTAVTLDKRSLGQFVGEVADKDIAKMIKKMKLAKA